MGYDTCKCHKERNEYIIKVSAANCRETGAVIVEQNSYWYSR
jgi:hypothetical protein